MKLNILFKGTRIVDDVGNPSYKDGVGITTRVQTGNWHKFIFLY